MAQFERITRRCQKLFDEAFGMEGGLPRVKWTRIQQLYTITPAYESDGETPKFVPVCRCGRNIMVHSPDCVLTKLELQIERYYFPVAGHDPQTGELINVREVGSDVWVLTKWLPPPPPDLWMQFDADLETYPAEGAYEPVSVNGTTVWMRGPCPTPGVTEWVIKQFKYFWENRRLIEQQMDDKLAAKDWVPHKDERGRYEVTEKGPSGNKFHQYRDQFRDAMTLNGHIPGEKGGVGYATPQKHQQSPLPSPDVPRVILARD